jgi:hypothetical protein
MAAVMALILLPVVAAVGVMVKASAGGSFGVTFAMLCFTLLAAGVFAGLFKMARRWENEA